MNLHDIFREDCQWANELNSNY